MSKKRKAEEVVREAQRAAATDCVGAGSSRQWRRSSMSVTAQACVTSYTSRKLLLMNRFMENFQEKRPVIRRTMHRVKHWPTN